MRRALGLVLLLGCHKSIASEVPREHERAPSSTIATPCAEPWIRAAMQDGVIERIPAVDIAIRSEGPVAQTTMTLTFLNDDELADGVVASMRVPEEAVLSAFEVEHRERWLSSSPIDRPMAHHVDEAIAAAGFDDGELEGRVDFQVRPVAGRSRTRVRITWLQPVLDGAPTLEMPLCGGPTIDTLTLTHGGQRRRWHDVRRVSNLRVPLPPGRASAIRAGDWVAAELEAAPPPARESLSQLTMLVDTSASRARTFDRDLDALDDIFAELARREPSATVRVVAFDQRGQVVYDGPVDGSATAIAKLRERGALGATDFIDALMQLQLHPIPKRVVMLTDATPTIGDTMPESRIALIDRFAKAGIRRVDTLATAGTDGILLDKLSAHGAQPGVVLAIDLGAKRIVDALTRPHATATVTIPGASFVSLPSWPHPAGSRLLLARLPASAPWQPALVGVTIEQAPHPIDDDLLAPLGAAAQFAAMQRATEELAIDGEEHSQLIANATRFALDHGVLSRYTAWSVSDSTLVLPAVREVYATKPPPMPTDRRSRLDRLLQEREAARIRALETWARRRAEGIDAGPKPDDRRFADPQLSDATDLLREHLIVGLERPSSSRELAKVEAALAAGDLGEARSLAERWFARKPSALAAIAGGRVATAEGRHDRAARWFGSTHELEPVHAPLHGAGAFFVDFARVDARDVELMIDSRTFDLPARTQVLLGIAALARGEPARAVEAFSAAHEAASEHFAAPQYGRLLAIAAAVAGDSSSRAMLRDKRIARSRARERVIVLVATDTAPGAMAMLVEGSDRALLSPRFADVNPVPGVQAGMYLHSATKSAVGDGRVLVHAGIASAKQPLVGALWVITHDGQGHATVAHHPFAFTNSDATLAFDLTSGG